MLALGISSEPFNTPPNVQLNRVLILLSVEFLQKKQGFEVRTLKLRPHIAKPQTEATAAEFQTTAYDYAIRVI